jgi:exosome complex exonuclease DIS3/RRP44
VLDTNIVLEQIDLLESDGLEHVIVLATVLEEVRHRSSPIFKRIKDIISDPKRNFYVFVNEHRRETYIERRAGESANDRNDRAIRVASLWYQRHLQEAGLPGRQIVILSDDKMNRQLAADEDLESYSIQEYVASMKDFPNLVDKINQKDAGSTGFGKRFLFPEHLAPVQINSGLKSGKFLQGVFYLSRTNFLEGSISCEGREAVLLQGLEAMNRAVDGDSVAVQLLEDRLAPAEVVLEDDGYDPGDTLDRDRRLLESAVKSKDVQASGRVVGIVRRKWRQYCGMLQPNPVKGSNRHIFVAAEKKIPKVRIMTSQSEALSNQRIIVAIDSWPRTSRYPVGHFVRALGKIGDKATENEVLLLEHDIPHSSFSEAVLDCLPDVTPEKPWTISARDRADRVDCRHLDICSVDPPVSSCM